MTGIIAGASAVVGSLITHWFAHARAREEQRTARFVSLLGPVAERRAAALEEAYGIVQRLLDKCCTGGDKSPDEVDSKRLQSASMYLPEDVARDVVQQLAYAHEGNTPILSQEDLLRAQRAVRKAQGAEAIDRAVEELSVGAGSKQ